jgi:transketolase
MENANIDGGATRRLANAIRALSMDGVEAAKSGHPGMPMGMADAATVLYSRFLKFDATDATWPDRDRFILSAGHGSMLLYSLLYLTGYDLPLEDLKHFRRLGFKTPGHPENFVTEGVETTTGPLGQGLANAVGMALAERHLSARFGADLVDHRTWVIVGDGCLMEGISHEAIALAGRQKLNKLVVIWDNNSISIDGPVSLSDITDQKARFAACGWNTFACDGHDAADLARAFEAATKSDKPAFIDCKTIIGFGAPKKEGTRHAHGEPLGAEEIAAARKALDWNYPPFEIPDALLSTWRAIGSRGGAARKAWEDRLAGADKAKRDAFEAALSGEIPEAAIIALHDHAKKMAETKTAMATRASSGAAIEAVFEALPELLGGSADLTPSNNTLVKGATDLTSENPGGRYIRYGIREHGMAAAMNGMALHGGIIPYGGTFMCFSDYSRPAVRLAALMGARVIHVFTHDSIGLGEDGPTHQPVEHLAALRAIPNLYVFRPADAVEAAECWAAALLLDDAPSALALSRQSTPGLRDNADENLSVRGAYELLAADGEARVALFATGTEVALAVQAREALQAKGIPTRVVSAPCFELFELQDEDYQESVCGSDEELKIGVEAAIAQGWFEAFGLDAFVGMTGFGASAPGKDVYEHFNLTADAIVETAEALLES